MNNKYISLTIFLTALIIIAVPWFTIQSQYLVNGNISWLLIAASRLLEGQSLSEHIFETNPPLSILIYVPHVLFSKAFGLPLPVGSFYFTSILVMISTLAVYYIIKPFTFLSFYEKTALILGYIVSVTLITTLFFSDREHLIIIALIPFVLSQYAITHRIELHKIVLVPVMVIGAVFILIKPHYGLLPSVFLLDRMIRQKRLNIFFDPDFIALSTMTLAYIGLIFIFFYDYIEIIFPDVLALYTTNSQPRTVIESIQVHLIACCALFFIELFREDLEKEKKSILLFLYTCALLCLVPYFVQMKGFYNHIVPIYAFFICALTLSMSFRVSKYIGKYGLLHFIIPLVGILLIAHVVSPLNKKYPKQTDIPNLPVARFLEKECPAPCTFFAFHGNIEIFNPTAAYMGYTHATRFPTLWFLPRTLWGLASENPNDRAVFEGLKKKYTQIVADDLEHYKPSVLLIMAELPIANIPAFDFPGFFSSNQHFKNIFEENYEKDGRFEFDRAEYFTGTTLEKSYIVKYDIYRRKKNLSPNP